MILHQHLISVALILSNFPTGRWTSSFASCKPDLHILIARYVDRAFSQVSLPEASPHNHTCGA